MSTIEPASASYDKQEFHTLSRHFDKIPIQQLRLIVIELVSFGLVKDEGVGRWGAAAMEKFTPLPTAEWLFGWIQFLIKDKEK